MSARAAVLEYSRSVHRCSEFFSGRMRSRPFASGAISVSEEVVVVPACRGHWHSYHEHRRCCSAINIAARAGQSSKCFGSGCDVNGKNSCERAQSGELWSSAPKRAIDSVQKIKRTRFALLVLSLHDAYLTTYADQTSDDNET